MSNVRKVSTLLNLDLTDIPESKITKAKKEVGNFLVNEILRSVGNGRSPVEGESFRRLQKDYAKREKGGSRLPNLELDGDMLSKLKAIGVSKKDPFLEVGIFGRAEAPKADGHNQISEEAKSWARRTDRTQYKRRFIPDSDQDFKPKIQKGVNDILNSYREEPIELEVDVITLGVPTSRTTTPETTQTTVDDLFSEEFLENLLLLELEKQGRL